MTEQSISEEVKRSLTTSVALALIILVVWPFIKPAVWALAVVISSSRLRTSRLQKSRFKWVYSSGAMTIWVALCLLIPFAFIAASITVEAAGAAAKLADPSNRDQIVEVFREKAVLISPYLDKFGIAPEELPSKLAGMVGPRIGNLLTAIAGAAGNLLIDSAFFILFTYIFFSRGRSMADTLSAALPATAAGGVRVAAQALASSLLGVVATAAVQGAVGSLGIWVAGLPSPLLFFLAMAVASLIPGIGTFLVWGPAAAWLAVTGHHVAAGGLAAWGILVIGSIDNFVRPVVAARFGHLDLLVAVVGSLGGLALFGFTGVLIGPTILAASIELLKRESPVVVNPGSF